MNAPRTRAVRRDKRSEQQKVDEFNRQYSPGTEVRYWTGFRQGKGETGFTKSLAFLCSAEIAVIFIAGASGYISLTHVEPIEGAPADDDLDSAA